MLFRPVLTVYIRPCDPSTGIRIPPGGFEAHKRTHDFRTPCCLCAFLDNDEYTESHVGVVESLVGENHVQSRSISNGEYIAVCGRNRCGYFGQSFMSSLQPRLNIPSSSTPVCLERFYLLPDIKTRMYDQRGEFGYSQFLSDCLFTGNFFRLPTSDAKLDRYFSRREVLPKRWPISSSSPGYATPWDSSR